MEGLHVRSFDAPDDTLPMGDTARAERVNVGGLAVWRAILEPGWRYSEHVEGGLCPAPHAAYIVSGTLHIVMEDGTEAEAGPGSIVTIAPGHDAWTVGNEPCVFIDFGEGLAAGARGTEAG